MLLVESQTTEGGMGTFLEDDGSAVKTPLALSGLQSGPAAGSGFSKAAAGVFVRARGARAPGTGTEQQLAARGCPALPDNFQRSRPAGRGSLRPLFPSRGGPTHPPSPPDRRRYLLPLPPPAARCRPHVRAPPLRAPSR